MGEVRMVGFNTVPRGWAICNGALLPINQNQALFSLLGVTYGGDGVTTFALPDLRSRIPVGFGQNYTLGLRAGAEQVTLTPETLATHTHSATSGTIKTSGEGVESTPDGLFIAASTVNQFAPSDGSGALAADSVKLDLQPAGSNQPHENRQPYLTINYLISLTGIFPSRA